MTLMRPSANRKAFVPKANDISINTGYYNIKMNRSQYDYKLYILLTPFFFVVI